MNFDEFEQKLRNAPPRKIPAAWRAEILSPTRQDEPAVAWWKQWLWPHPAAWASLAAVWVAIFVLYLAGAPEPLQASGASMRPGPEILQAVQERTRLMAELSDEASSPRDRPSPVDGPRSHRRVLEAIA